MSFIEKFEDQDSEILIKIEEVDMSKNEGENIFKGCVIFEIDEVLQNIYFLCSGKGNGE